MNNQSYPNLMCFGRDINNCPLLDSCPDYKKCKEKYDEDWLVLFNEDE